MTDLAVRLGARKTAFCRIALHINCTGDHKSYIYATGGPLIWLHLYISSCVHKDPYLFACCA